MLELTKSESRNYLKHGWLTSYRSFPFDERSVTERTGYSVLNAFNDNEIKGGMGFGMESHQDVEIVTYILSGELHYHDNAGNKYIAKKGDVQRLTAGSGVRHSEYNLSANPVHVLQLWIDPFKKGLPFSCEKKSFPIEAKENKWCLVVSSFGHLDSIAINQDVDVYACVLNPAYSIEMHACQKRSNYLHVAKGVAICNGVVLEAGDALKIQEEANIEIETAVGAELIWLDLPPVT